MTTIRGGMFPAATARLLLAFAVTVLAACGGGGGGGGAGTTPLPATLAVVAPAAQQPLSTALAFTSNAVDPALVYAWDFGDGTSSTLAAPSHAYARAGVFTVRLVVGNGSGALAATAAVQIADFAVVAGKACSGTGQSGWCWQRPLPQGNFIADYAFVDDSHGWAVGDQGTILATTDGGVTWNVQSSGTQLFLGRATFASALVGWVAGSSGELLKTADGGASWRRVSFGRNDFVQAIGATDAEAAWVTTTQGDAFVTSNGGLQWRQVRGPGTGSFRIIPVSVGDVWSLAPFYTAQPSLSHSIDGGASWVAVALPAIDPGLAGYPFDLQFPDRDHAIVSGFESGYRDADPTTYVARPTLFVTADRGASWQPVSLPPGAFNPVFSLAGTSTVFAFSYGSGIQRTTDNGATWQAVSPPAAAFFYATGFKAFTPQRLLVTDGMGRVWYSIDGGAAWNQRSARGTSAAALNSLWFFDSREGLGIADDGSATRTADGGRTWTTSEATSAGWRRAQFLADGSVGWVISDLGTIYRSTDKGRTWLAPVPMTSAFVYGVTDFHFVDAQRGWAVAPYSSGGSGGAIYTSSDGGLSWQAVAGTALSYGFVAIRFADALHGVAVGPAGVAIVTSDGGATWAPRPTGVGSGLRRVAFIDATTAVAVGENGAIVRSTDRGQSWQLVTGTPAARTLNDVRFLDARIGHAVGEGGAQLVSRDGGLSWSANLTRTQMNLQAVFFVDEQTGWIAGSEGSILATATGGR